jgi:hypothetical protein
MMFIRADPAFEESVGCRLRAFFPDTRWLPCLDLKAMRHQIHLPGNALFEGG